MQLLRQFLTEGVILSAAGGLLGLVIAFTSLDLLVAFAARFTPRAAEIHIDGPVLLFTAAVSLVIALVFGCVPAFTSRRDVSVSLRATSRHTSNSSRDRDLLERLRAIATVTVAGAGSTFPLADQPRLNRQFIFKDIPVEDSRALPQAKAFSASPGYFQALGIPVLEGRDFAESDRADSAPVIVVNRSMSRYYWRLESPLGRQISTDTGKTWLSVVGVVADSKNTLEAEVEDAFYVPLEQVPVGRTILIRTTGNPATIGSLVRRAVHSVDREQPVDSLRTLEDVRSESISSPRLTMTLLSLFAGLALLITATGIGGVVGFFVNQRRHEIGSRIALGAKRHAVLWLVR